MSRLPVVGADDSVWGTVLNDYLSVAHNADGTLKGGTAGLPGYFSITTYGAATASADNKTAIDNTIAAAAVAGGVVWIPPGTWTTTGHHNIPLNVSVLGAGRQISILNFTGVSTYCFFIGSVTGGPNPPNYMGEVGHFTISGQSAGNGSGPFGTQIGINVLNCLFFNVQDVFFSLLWKAMLIDGGDEVGLGAGTFAGQGYCANLGCSNVYIGFHIARWVTDSVYNFLYCYGQSPKVAGGWGLYIPDKASTSTFVNFSTEGIDGGIYINTSQQGLHFVNPRLEDCNTYVSFGSAAYGVFVDGGEEYTRTSAHIDWPYAGPNGSNTVVSRSGWFPPIPDAGLPVPSANYRWSILRQQGAGGVKDNVWICTKDASNVYNWHEITTPTAAAAATGNPGPTDQGLKGWTYDGVQAGASGTAPGNGNIKYWKVIVPTAATITGVAAYVIAAATGPTNTYFGLYDSGGTRQAVTADTSATTTSGGTQQFAFTAPYAAAAGTWYIGFVQGGSTGAVQLARAPIGSSTHYNLGIASAPFRFNTGAAGATALPATVTLSGLAASSDAYWAALY